VESIDQGLPQVVLERAAGASCPGNANPSDLLIVLNIVGAEE
jgi:hypothetical protein